MKGKNIIYTPAEIASAAKDGIVVSADGVYDYNREKFQEQINADILEEQRNIQQRISDLTSEDVGALPFNINYAGSNSPGGAANSSEKLNTDAGSSKKAVYFENGIPVEIDHSVNKDVPADAEFTDTKNTAGATNSDQKLFLIGSIEQSENPQTYSRDSTYIGSDGCLYSGNQKVITDISHKADKANSVTNVEYSDKKITRTINGNTSDIVSINKIKEDLELNNVTNDSQVKRSEMGVANGIATLGSDGKVPSNQLPGYVDDVIELLDMSETSPQNYFEGDYYYNTNSKKLFKALSNNSWDDGTVPSAGKIYTNLKNNKTYRWGGSEMAVISDTLAIGNTQGTAFDGKEGYDHVTNNNIHVTTEDKNYWNNKGTYSKPDQGIPKSDLHNDVQESLNKANTAIQQETDPTVPSWAKQSTKPFYNLDEVSDGANRKIPTKISELENDSNFTGNLGTVTKVKVGIQEHMPTNGVVELPAYPNTLPASDVYSWAKQPNKPSYNLDEIQDGNIRKLEDKVDKVNGKGLSTNDYTNEDKAKLGTIEQGAQVHIAPTASEVKQALNMGEGTSKYLREDGTWVTPPNDNTTYEEATTQESGLMSSQDKQKLDNIEPGAQVHIAPTTEEVKNALGTGNGNQKYLREDGTWQVPPDTTYQSKVPQENGYDVSLVTTGDKYTWNNKQNYISDLNTIRSNATKGAEAKKELIDYDIFIDLELPSGTLWAKYNIGADKDIDYGNYYRYGCVNKYNNSQTNYSGTENPLHASKDAATQTWGTPWHIPTRIQFIELIENTTYEWTTINGVNGGKFTAQNGNYIFFPASGNQINGNQSQVGITGDYLSSTPGNNDNIYCINIYNSNCNVYETSRDLGCSVRAVCETYPNKLSRKVDKVSGKDLSTNDYTNAEKAKLGGIEDGAQVHIAPTSTEVKNALGTTSETNKYLREDGTWQVPNYTDVSYSNNKFSKTINGNSSDIVTVDTLKSDMNLNKVENFKAVSTEVNQTLTDTEKNNARTNIGAGTSSLVIGTTTGTAADGKVVNDHINNTSNPHNVTKSQVELGNVTNDAQVKRSEMGTSNGVATLDNNGKVLSTQLPSYVDDVIEGYLYNEHFYKEAEHTNIVTDEGNNSTDRLSGKIYVDLSSNKTYRWGGSSYAVISDTLALGETSSTAYRGDRGKQAYDHISNTNNPHNVTKSQIGLGNVVNTGDSATPVEGGTTKFTTGGAYTELNKKADKDGTGATGTWGINISGNALSANYATNAGSVAWANIPDKPSTFTPSAHNHDSNYVHLYTYSIPLTKGVRITFSAYNSCIINACKNNNNGQLVLMGTGYGWHGTVRNTFTEVVSCSTKIFTWSLPEDDSISTSVEIMHNSTEGRDAVVYVHTSGIITFTEITALTSPATNRQLIHTSNVSPSLSTSNDQLKVTVGGIDSSYITIPYATNAGNSDKLDGKHAAEFVDQSNISKILGNLRESIESINNKIQSLDNKIQSLDISILGATRGYIEEVYSSTINNSGNINIEGEVIYSSDARKKENFSYVSNEELDIFNKSDGYLKKFTWKDNNELSFGVIAQEIKEFAPEAVIEGKDGYLYVNYKVALSKIVGALFRKVKEQEQIINDLKNKIK